MPGDIGGMASGMPGEPPVYIGGKGLEYPEGPEGLGGIMPPSSVIPYPPIYLGGVILYGSGAIPPVYIGGKRLEGDISSSYRVGGLLYLFINRHPCRGLF